MIITKVNNMTSGLDSSIVADRDLLDDTRPTVAAALHQPQTELLALTERRGKPHGTPPTPIG